MANKKIDPEFDLDDEQEALFAQQRALEPQPQISVNALPTRLYLEKTTLPTIYKALEALEKERPVNPVEFFSYYLITNNPYTQKLSNEVESHQKIQESPTLAELK
ncbi:hypothetical protein IMG5_172610 [Ichthyophthirius multifiliis]|uniref:Dpy-30 motif family protein n=1 Tax=Ichthyophthirius multifiliis TaxID=5932 RepID=G0R1T5_ICHMU|nr:hypothetical protein IMG5_172610 [Ichthyophthirius multifiliis]EGR28587.1 hypothetical protein IMG5_172610 [Ichthyophthirius multifiliis]|eukprot:XP_004029823.1 hypothetical protein IMG5_172610 [Ichthyophthirius multifiliis]